MARLLRYQNIPLVSLLTVISFLLPRTAVAQSIPHLVYGHLENYLGEYPTAEELEFCITLRPGEPTQQTLCFPDSSLFGWDYDEVTGTWRGECAEFNFWNVDEEVVVEFTITGAAGQVQSILDSSPAQNLGTTLIGFLPIIDPLCLPVATDEEITLFHDLIPCATDIEDLPEDLLWTITDWDEYLWETVTIAENQLTMTPLLNAWGEDEVVFIVTDTYGGSDSTTVTLLINPVNDPPVMELPEILSFYEDSSLVEDFSQYIFDLDNEYEDMELYTAGAVGIEIEIVNLQVTFSAPENWFGTEMISFYASDGEYFSMDSLYVAAVSVNDLPWVEDLLIGPEDPAIEDPLVVTYLFNDIENSTESGSIYNWYRDGELVPELTGLLTVAAEHTGFLEIWYFEITPSDGEDYGDLVQSNSLVINNSDPVLEGIPDLSLEEDGELQVDLYPYLADEEQPDSVIVLTLLNDPDPEHLAVAIDGQQLMLATLVEHYNDPVPLELILQADDQMGGFDTDTLLVTITPLNDAPLIDEGCLPVATIEDNHLVHDLTDCVTDIEDVPGEMSWVIDDWDDLLWESAEIVAGLLTMIPLLDVTGEDEVTLTVTDNGEAGGDELSDSALITLSITPANDAPQIELPDSLDFDEDLTLELDFGEFLFDVDSDTSLLLTVSGNQEIEVAIDGFMVTFSAAENWNGAEDITFTIDDQDLRLTDSDLITIVVNAVNDLPLIYEECLSPLATGEDATLIFDLTECASDVEDVPAELVWSLLEGEQADWDTTLWESFVIEGNILTAVPLLNAWGADSVTFLVTDLESGTTVLMSEAIIECRFDYGGRTDHAINRGSLLIIDLTYDDDCGTPEISDDLPEWLTYDAGTQTVRGRPTVEASPQLFTMTFAMHIDTLTVDFSVELLGTLIDAPGEVEVEIPADENGYFRFVLNGVVDPPYYLVITQVDLPERSDATGMSPWTWQVDTDLPTDINGYTELYLPEQLPFFMESLDFTPTHLYFYNRFGTADDWTRQTETEVLDEGTRLMLDIDRMESGEWTFGAWFEDVTADRLWQNYPNPFNDETRIGCDIKSNNTPVELAIYNAVGDKVWQDRTMFNAGDYLQNYFLWNGRNRQGSPVGSGIYIIRVKIAGKVYTKQAVFLRGN
jgi:hypothetical protein